MGKIKIKPSFWGIIWIMVLTPIILLILLLIMVSYELFGPIPDFKALEDPSKNISTEIITSDSVVIGSYYYENRSFVDYNNLSPNIINALIATEDVRFHKHSGIDFRGLGRVIFKTILLGSSSSGGGSTVTQQLAKNLFPRDTLTYKSGLLRKMSLGIVKFKEWVTAAKLERNYTKEEIMVMYFNTVPFGSNAFGIKMASKTFFNKIPDSIKIEEAAVLVGLLKAPTKYSPVLNPENSLGRRNVVLDQMYKYKFISSKEELDSLKSLSLQINFKSQDHNEGIGTYYRETIRLLLTSKKPQRKSYYTYEDYLSDSIEWEQNALFGWCEKNYKPDGSAYNIYSDGLKIYTTLDSRMQRYAELGMRDHLGKVVQPEFNIEKKHSKSAPFSKTLTHDEVRKIMETSVKRTERYRVLKNNGLEWKEILKNFKTKTRMRVFSYKGEIDTTMTPWDSILYYKHFLRSGFIAIDPHNGYIKAYVGGIDFKHFKFDHVKQGKRQVGSTIKPFLYTLAMAEGFSPCYKVMNVPVTFFLGDTTWTPKNSGKNKYDGQMVTLRWGLANSVNNITAWVMKQFNPSVVINDVMRKMGITSKLDPVPSLVLGTPDISLYEMVGAYATYANKGVYTKPVFVTRIEDKNGNILFSSKQIQKEAINENTAYLMVNMMESVINAGTGARLRYLYNFDFPIAGKTGTTQNHSDGWFIGITPNLVAGTWVGGEDRSIHFDGIDKGQGASMALPIWANFFKKVHENKNIKLNWSPFERPANFNYDLYCADNTQEIKSIEELKEIEAEY